MTATKKKTYEQKLVAQVAADVSSRTKKHVITTIKLDGMYRHWRCAKTGECADHFNIVTWPGSLCYTGDMGDFLFQRTNDMVAFMRGSVMSHSYAAEKCTARGSPIREWRDEVFDEVLKETVRDYEDFSYSKSELAEIVRRIRDAVNDENGEHDSIQAMWNSELWDGSDLPDCTAYTFRFLWCLYAIKWFCDNVKDA